MDRASALWIEVKGAAADATATARPRLPVLAQGLLLIGPCVPRIR